MTQESPKSILKKKSAYEVRTGKPPPANDIVRPGNEPETGSDEELKSVNVAQARKMFNSESPAKSAAPSKIPLPVRTPVYSAPDQKADHRTESEPEMDWDDDFDLLGKNKAEMASYKPAARPEDYVSDTEDESSLPDSAVPAYELKPTGQPATTVPVSREPWSDSEESLAVDDEDSLGMMPSGNFPKASGDPETQSILSQQSVTLTESHELKSLALKHFSQPEEKKDDFDIVPKAQKATFVPKEKPEDFRKSPNENSESSSESNSIGSTSIQKEKSEPVPAKTAPPVAARRKSKTPR